MSIEDLKVKDLLELTKLISGDKSEKKNRFLGKTVIVRTYSAGVWCGVLDDKQGNEVILSSARRMFRWHAAKGTTCSELSIHGIDRTKSRINEPVPSVWLEAIEILPCTDVAIKSIESCPEAQAQ